MLYLFFKNVQSMLTIELPTSLITLFCMDVLFCFIINQDERNQMMTTNVWVKQVGFHQKTAHNWALMRFLIGTGLLLLHSPPLSYLLVVSGDERTCFPAGVERLQAVLEPRGV